MPVTGCRTRDRQEYRRVVTLNSKSHHDGSGHVVVGKEPHTGSDASSVDNMINRYSVGSIGR
jgi:hypothetical protein